MKKTLNILLVTAWYPYQHNSQYGLFVKHFAQMLSGFHKVTVLALIEQQSIVEPQLDKNDRSKDLTEIIQLIPRGSNPLLRVFRRKRTVSKLLSNELPELNSFDLVHFQVLSPLHYCLVSSVRKMNIPYVVTEHSSMYARGLFDRMNPISKLRIKSMAGHAKAVLPVSQFLQRSMEKSGIKANYKVVNNAVDAFQGNTLPKYDQPTLLAVGDLVDDVKNISGMIHCLRWLHDNGHPFFLKIIGSGRDEKKLVNLTKALGLSNFIQFTGELPHVEVLAEMSKCHVYLMASPIETFSISTLEALKCGTPVVTTDCGGIREYFEDLGGMVVSPFDEQEFAKAILEIIEHPEWYRSSALQTAFGEKCSTEMVMSQLNEIYYSMIEKP